MFDFNPQRTGVGPSGSGIVATSASSLRARAVHIDGVVDSSPIELHAIRVSGRDRDVAFVTTTYGRTVAFDPGSGRKLWHFVPRDVGSYQGSDQITTASPLADPGRRYVFTASPDGFIHKLSVTSGRQVWASRVTFDPGREKIEGGLNLSGRFVIVATGGYYGDTPSYQGHVVLIDRATGHVAHVFNSLCSDRHKLIDPPRSCPASDSAIWGRAGVVVEPGTGRLLVATGNGPFNGSTNWGDSVLELSPDATRLLHNWTPGDQAHLRVTDTDVGSTSPAILTNHLLLQGGKDGKLVLLDSERLDGTRGGPGPRTGGAVQTLSSPGGGAVLTAPAVWRQRGRTEVFVADDSGTAGYVLSGDRLKRLWQDDTAGTSPVLAAGLLYVYDEVRGALKILRPGNGAVVASLPAAPGHWNSPIVVGGRVILPVGGGTLGPDRATNGTVLVYHIPGR
jgi:outer membrane protein assembly factor BamB